MRAILAFACFCFGVAAPVAHGAAPPNVILIVAEEAGYGDFGFTGNPVILTPHLDALAAESAQLGTFYAQLSDEATLSTLETGVQHPGPRVGARTRYKRRKWNLLDDFLAAGYESGYWGVELGIPWIRQHAGRKLPFILTIIPTMTPLVADPGLPISKEDLATLLEPQGSGRATAPDGTWPSAEVESRLEELSRIASGIMQMDADIGDLMSTLEQEGIKENTIVVFMTYGGPSTRRFVGSWRGVRGEVLEGGVRSPFLMHWPNMLNASHRFDGITSVMDVMPTLLDACGVSHDPGSMDGRSLLPSLLGTGLPWTGRKLIIQGVSEDGSLEPSRYFLVRTGSLKLFEEGVSDLAHVKMLNLEGNAKELLLLPEEGLGYQELRSTYDAWLEATMSRSR